MRIPLPTIYRDCNRLRVHTDDMVRRFSRYNKYTVGPGVRRREITSYQGKMS
jgi:hypothetical protein